MSVLATNICPDFHYLLRLVGTVTVPVYDPAAVLALWRFLHSKRHKPGCTNCTANVTSPDAPIAVEFIIAMKHLEHDRHKETDQTI